MTHPSMKDERTREQEVDEVLETVWSLNEMGRFGLRELRRSLHMGGLDQVLGRMVRGGLVRRKGESLALSPRGEKRALLITRRHRLAERLLTDLLDITGAEVESSACKFEHILSPGVTDSVCTLLGHPPSCPHGKPIPRGGCCTRSEREIEPVVRRLTEMEAGGRGRILFLSPRTHTRLDRLMSLGVTPGTQIRLHQRHPSYVVEMGETTLALDREVAGDIYVRVDR